MIDQHLRQRQKAAAFHTLWELGQARAALRRMGETLEEPPPRSREAFADAIYNLTGEGQGDAGPREAVRATALEPASHSTRSPHLSVLPGGLEDPVSESGFAAGGRSEGQVRQLRMGGKPPLLSSESVAAHPHPSSTNKETT